MYSLSADSSPLNHPNSALCIKKLKMPRILIDFKAFLQFLFYSTSITGNIHHTLTPFPFYSYSLDCPETRTVKI